MEDQPKANIALEQPLPTKEGRAEILMWGERGLMATFFINLAANEGLHAWKNFFKSIQFGGQGPGVDWERLVKVWFVVGFGVKGFGLPDSVARAEFDDNSAAGIFLEAKLGTYAEESRPPTGRHIKGFNSTLNGAMELQKRGRSYRSIATTVDASLSSVVRCVRAYREERAKGLLPNTPGPPSRVSDTQKFQLKRILRHGPAKAGYGTNRWTLKLVTKVIEKHFQIRYHRCHVSKLLAQMGWSYQKAERCGWQKVKEVVQEKERLDLDWECCLQEHNGEASGG